MAREFNSANLYEFQDIVSTYPFSRRITEVHLHHTWRPRQSDYKGLATIEGMWRYHTQTNKWSDIGQHVTIAPNGAIWLCRNFNWAPASARGFNGNSSAGPFMIEMIGDFDIDEENIACDQVQATLSVIKAIQARFELDAHHLRFHNEMSSKSCPGSSVDKSDWIEQITAFKLTTQNSRGGSVPFPTRATRAYELMRGMNPDAEQTDDMSTTEHDGSADASPVNTRGGTGSVEGELNVGVLEALSAHTVNLERGLLSTTGRLETTASDVDRLFDELLPEEIKRAKAEGRKAQLLFYAHGGLVSEKNALLTANKQLPFWRANGVYPIFFIWETGFAETVRQLVDEAASRTRGPLPSTRGPLEWVTDNVTDPIIEQIARTAGGRLIWGGMKSSAELASTAGHGAAYVAAKTAELIKRSGKHVDVHVVGHSAGTIFLSHFMPLLVEKSVLVKTANFLAPAVRNDLFHQNVAPLLGNGIGPLSLFTMNKRREKQDTVASIYQKSLLYLVSRAFEDSSQTDILGLEESLRSDVAMRQIFGLHGHSSQLAEVIWSPTPDSQSGNGSTSLTHSGFDDDVTTMESVLRRVLDLRAGEAIEPFPGQGTRGIEDFWNAQFDWPDNLEYLSALRAQPDNGVANLPKMTAQLEASDNVITTLSNETLSDMPNGKKNNKNKNKKNKKKNKKSKNKNQKIETSENTFDNLKKHQNIPVSTSDGRRLALCIGIDEYIRSPLAGCVADAKLWKKTLTTLGFEVKLLTNSQATADNIRHSVRKLVESSRPGDQLALQFAGHGTQFEDLDEDEAAGDTPALDECLCGVDCGVGDDGLVIDDELRLIIETLPEGVTLTCFFDCCHSGSATRAALRMAGDTSNTDVRARFMSPNEAMEKAYIKQIKKIRKAVSRAPVIQKDVLFSACRSSELAYESDRQGDFTRHATAIIAAGTSGLNNADFLNRILQSFGSNPRQTPEIHCDVSAHQTVFLQPAHKRQQSKASGGSKQTLPESA
ncbi:caspase family protein [Granulosicoccus antarcticus]|uniref:Uncharacterized protein n=1 Tax=Granulosicoccus antarcticus IMCC3135 TaxID=1192854 RepID=A0A2Z2NLN4_9GAMM|nr:caspase family protein [Granulosicoccus antarcticus]ASJ70881.1 hypothetical protein IMCC3135_03840 [Granulosicoccus antarcticus IMCC3135]